MTKTDLSNIFAKFPLRENALLYSPFSASKLGMHNQCPRKFKYRHLLKVPEGESDKTALFKGIQMHNYLENYPNTDNVKIKPEYKVITDRFIESDLGKKYFNDEQLKSIIRESQVKIEYKNNELIASDQNRKDLLFFGYVDYVNVIEVNGEKILSVVDWKSGKYVDQRYQDYSQLLFYQIYYFLRTEASKIRISFCYIEHMLENDLILERKYLNNYISTLLEQIYNTENSDFKPNFSRLCDWCPYTKICQSDNS